MALTHIVMRPVDAGTMRLPGEAVDASTWKHWPYLEEGRKIRAIMPGEDPIACDCGRHWLSVDQAAGHCAKPAKTKEKTAA